MADAEAPAALTQGIGVPQVLELFEPQITALSGTVETAEEHLELVRGALGVADDAVQRAEAAREGQREALSQAQRDVRNSEQWLANGRKAAVGALHTLDVSPHETFVGQTVIEGGSKEEAEGFLEEFHGFNAGTDLSRLIVLGSFPVRAAFVDGNRFDYHGVSFVDVNHTPGVIPVSLRRETGGHFVRIEAAEVTQVPFNSLAVFRESTHDTTPRQRYVNASPLDVHLVTTAEQVVQLTGGQELDEVPKKYGATTVGAEEEDSFPPTIIAGEAVGKFTEWLARNEWMRTMVYAATADENGHAEHVSELPEDSEAISDARGTFRQRLLLWANHLTMVGGASDEETVASLRNEPLLQPNVQRYLDISDEMITEWLIEDLKSDVTLESSSRFTPADQKVTFSVDNHSQIGRYFTSVEHMCDFIGQNFEDAGFSLEGVMPRVAKGIKISLLEQKLERMSVETRDDRKYHAKVSAALDAVRAAE